MIEDISSDKKMEILFNCLEMLIRKANNNPQGRHVHLGTPRLRKLKPVLQLKGLGVVWNQSGGAWGSSGRSREQRMQSLSKPESPNWRNQIVGHWFSFCVRPWTAQSEFRMKWDTVGLPRLGLLSLFPLSCPGGTRQLPFPNMPLDPLPASSGKRKARNLSGLLNWSDQ